MHFLEKAMDENDAFNLNNLINYFIYMVSAWNLVIQLVTPFGFNYLKNIV